ncbi:DUF2537 domain-containing protein [Actinophytocola sp.]|uniref:DUF2537 domain-containing protein n=1 Tax=Actinophytocola sp. TaxID=1872138 RepID=UPI0039C85E09
MEGAAVQLRANGERAVLVGHDGVAEREVDPRRLPLGTELTDALHEWARVASAVRRSDPDTSAAASAVVTRRGLQLAGRVAASMGVPVGYLDPLSGEESVVEPPEDARPARPTRPPEPVPWLTGLTVAAASLALVLITILSLAVTLADTHVLLALASNAVVTAGLLPSLWLIRRQPIWRWVALGVAVAIALGWLALPFIVL